MAVLSVSRRTDIPAFYTDWFMNRIKEGSVMVRNPMNPKQISSMRITPDVVDCIVFWTKNPDPIMSHLTEIGSRYPYYFQYTLNSYDYRLEPCIPALDARIGSFKSLSLIIGKENVIWRYDPILMSQKQTVVWHTERFAYIAKHLEDYTDTCVISFLDMYEKIRRCMAASGYRSPDENEMREIGKSFAEIAKAHGIRIQTCAEKIDLREFGISHGCCIDPERVAKATGWELNLNRHPPQREYCGCMESVDIGEYNTCRNGCLYCYANPPGEERAIYTQNGHDPASPLLVGHPSFDDKIVNKTLHSLKKNLLGQLSMF